jgi:hypothetical protein
MDPKRIMISQIMDILAAVLGAFRNQVGLSLLRLWFLWRRLSRKVPDFQSGWRIVMMLRPLLRGRANYANTYRDNWRHFALHKLLRKLRQHGCDQAPAIEVKNLAALTDPIPNDKNGLVLLTPHTRVMSAIDVVMIEHKIALCGISAYAGDMHELLHASGAGVDARLGPNTLLEALRHMRTGMVVYACPDFSVRRLDTFYHDIFVSPGMFDFVVQSNAQLVFAYCQMTNAGAIEVHLDRPTFSGGSTGSQDLSLAFLAFCTKCAPVLSDMRLARSGAKNFEAQQYKNLCTLTRSQRKANAT